MIAESETMVSSITESNNGRKSNQDKIIDALKKAKKALSTSDLAAAAGIDVKNIGRYLSKMEKEKLIERTTVQEGKKRSIFVSLITTRKKTDVESTTRKTETKIPSTGESSAKKENNQSHPITTRKEELNIESTTRREEGNVESTQNLDTNQNKSIQITTRNHDPYPPTTRNTRYATIPLDSNKVKQREQESINYINNIPRELFSFGKIVPLDVKQKITIEVFNHIKNLKKGIKYYLNAWEGRYNRYKKEKPNNPLIDEYQDMQKTLEFLKDIQKDREAIRDSIGKN